MTQCQTRNPFNCIETISGIQEASSYFSYVITHLIRFALCLILMQRHSTKHTISTNADETIGTTNTKSLWSLAAVVAVDVVSPSFLSPLESVCLWVGVVGEVCVGGVVVKECGGSS